MNKTQIDWPRLDYTWNPVVGCKHNCYYCYAKKMNDRFKWIPDWKEPKFFSERLVEPYRLRKPSIIFVGSMCDLFGSWVDRNWIGRIIKVAADNPEHQFMFLTKNPKGYFHTYFPKNCLLGLTLTGQESDINNRLDGFSMNQPTNYRFVSIEPLLGSFERVSLTAINLVIVGAMTGRGAIKPKREWIKSIKHPNIHYKSNIKL